MVRMSLISAIAITMSVVANSSQLYAANLVAVDVKKTQDWEGGLYRNVGSGRLFCGAEVASRDKTVLRIVAYKDAATPFLEILNENWDLSSVDTKIALENEKKIGMEFQMRSWGNAFTYDMKDEKTKQVILGFMMSSKALHIKNKNDVLLATFPSVGAREAMKAMLSCWSSR